jgi:protein CpxP
MLSKKIIAAAFAMILISSLTGCHNYSPEDRANFIVKRMKGDLDLTDTQMAKLEVVKTQWLENQAAQKPAREKEGDQVIAMIRSDKLDVAVLKGIIKEHEEKFNAFSPKLLDSMADLHSSLTPKQREKMADKLDELRKKFNHD